MHFQLDLSLILICSAVSLGVALVGMTCGFFIGRAYTLSYEPKQLKENRERTLNALLNLLASTEQLNSDVDSHNSELKLAKHDLQNIESDNDADLKVLQDKVMDSITRVVESNRKLENELVVSHYELERQAEELDRTRKEARTDTLCAVGNRKAFDEAFQFMLSRFQAHGVSFGLMLVDVDHFKRVNDTFGHQAGDIVLANIGTALNECVRPKDIVCRLGGDEFAILLNKLNIENGRSVGERIRKSIEKYNFSAGQSEQSTVVTLSMGLAMVGREDDIDSLFSKADTALYRSKELGRNRLYVAGRNSSDVGKPTEIEERILDDARQLSYEDIKADLMNEQFESR